MYIRILAKPKGIPAAHAEIQTGVNEHGNGQVNLVLYALDAFGIRTAVTSLRLSCAEARGLASELDRESNRALIAAREQAEAK